MWCLEGEECAARNRIAIGSLKTEMSHDGSCKSGRRRLRLGRFCIPRNPMPKLPPPPRVLCPPPRHNRMAIAASLRLYPQMPLLLAYLKPWRNWTSPHPHVLIPPSHHRLEWLIPDMFVEMTSWPQCAMP